MGKRGCSKQSTFLTLCQYPAAAEGPYWRSGCPCWRRVQFITEPATSPRHFVVQSTILQYMSTYRPPWSIKLKVETRKWRRGLIEPTDEMARLRLELAKAPTGGSSQQRKSPLDHSSALEATAEEAQTSSSVRHQAPVATSLPHHLAMTGMDGCNRQTQQTQARHTHTSQAHTPVSITSMAATNTPPVRVDCPSALQCRNCITKS